MITLSCPSGSVIVTVKSKNLRDAPGAGVTHRFTRIVWPRPTVVGLKLRYAPASIVATGVTPVGRSPATGDVGSAAFTIVMLGNVERVISSIRMIAVFLKLRIFFIAFPFLL